MYGDTHAAHTDFATERRRRELRHSSDGLRPVGQYQATRGADGKNAICGNVESVTDGLFERRKCSNPTLTASQVGSVPINGLQVCR
jgi:hypothetical protein